MTKKHFQKPIEYSISFRYICPNIKCNYDHWLFLREAKTKNFKIVCECGTIFQVKQIDEIKLIYNSSKKNVSGKISGSTNDVPIDIMNSCVTILSGYGFDKTEAKELITKAYSQVDDKSPVNIIKNALKLLEIENV